MAANRSSARRAERAFATDGTPSATRRATSSASSPEGVTSTTVSSPLPCSAWARRSAATNPGSAVSSASTTTSLGPASWSISTVPRTCRLASTTNALPGPTIFATAGTVSVPYAHAPTACAPPTRKTESVTPAMTSAAARPGLVSRARGGVTTCTRGTPATRAGIAFMSTDDGYAPAPPGT